MSVDSTQSSSIGQGTQCRKGPNSPCLLLRTCSRCHDFHSVYSNYDLVVDLFGDTDMVGVPRCATLAGPGQDKLVTIVPISRHLSLPKAGTLRIPSCVWVCVLGGGRSSSGDQHVLPAYWKAAPPWWSNPLKVPLRFGLFNVINWSRGGHRLKEPVEVNNGCGYYYFTRGMRAWLTATLLLCSLFLPRC